MERRKLAITAFVLDHHLSEATYADLGELLVRLGVDVDALAPYFKTLRAQAMLLAFNNLISMSEIVEGQRLPVVNVASIVKYWLSHSVIGPLACQVSAKHTIPYLSSRAAMEERILQSEHEVRVNGVSALWTAPKWIRTYLNQETLWREEYDAAERLRTPVVALHLLVFVDDFDLHIHRDKNYGVHAMTLAYVHHGLRSYDHSPAVVPVVMWGRRMKGELGYDKFAEAIARRLRALAGGISVWSVHHQRPVKAFALVHLVKGDGPIGLRWFQAIYGEHIKAVSRLYGRKRNVALGDARRPRRKYALARG